ncbi:MAG: SDR family NAD(P)-dependent oxidoreductase [Bacillota bacterium]
MPLRNKTAAITGSGQGIGRAIALAMGAAGCRVIVSDLNKPLADQVAEEIRKQGGTAISLHCDATSQEDISKLIDEAMEEFGTIDILVNNAGIFPFTPFESMTEEDWDKVMSTNLKSVFLCSHAASKVMSAGGRIINISSISAFVGFSGLTHYSASKSGLNGFTRALALELAVRQITVNGIAPGSIETPGATVGLDETLKEQTVAAIPLGRMGSGDDIAQLAVFLSGEGASYITGQTIIVDGGWTLR